MRIEFHQNLAHFQRQKQLCTCKLHFSVLDLVPISMPKYKMKGLIFFQTATDDK